jgi:hypothetical protein
MNGSNGIIPTVDLATNNTYPYMYGGYGNNGFFGGDGIWALLLLALIWNGNGFGGFGNNGFNNLATTDFVSSQFTQNTLQDLSTQLCSGFANTNSNISNGFADLNSNLCNVRSDILTGNMGLQNAILDSKYANAIGDSNTQRDILIQTTQLENQLSNVALSNQAHIDSCCCEIKAQGLENTQRILDAINTNTIADLREKLNEAQTEISNRNIESSIINSVRPYPTPAWLVSSPYQSIYSPYGNIYGNGFYGTTVI